MAHAVDLKVRKLETLVIKVDVRELRVRIWLGMQALRLGAWIMGGRCEINVDIVDGQ